MQVQILNLMVGVLGYTLCSGIICEELNGEDYVTVPYRGEKDSPDSDMELGIVTRKNHIITPVGERYISELKRYLGIDDAEKSK